MFNGIAAMLDCISPLMSVESVERLSNRPQESGSRYRQYALYRPTQKVKDLQTDYNPST